MNIKKFIKEDPVLTIACILAIISCFFVTPSLNYLDYINWNTLIILLIMMIIVESLKLAGLFDYIIKKLLHIVKTTRGLILVLVFTSFFASMAITNDITLILFVPLAILILKRVEREDLTIITLVLQTIAANMGSMIIPVGSPHNILLFTLSGISAIDFVMILLPYFVIALIFLLVICLLLPSEKLHLKVTHHYECDKSNFVKRVFTGVDYLLLVTFIAFFILIGNLQNIPAISHVLKQVICGNEVICGILLSQVMSNVPSGMMLCGFSTNYKAIIIGINIGGLGSLIASMANLITYRLFVKEYNDYKTKFLIKFTLFNVVLLIILFVAYLIL